MTLLISGATVIDGVADEPIVGKAIYIEDRRIRALCDDRNPRVEPGTEIIDARGKFAIPGLMNANVHLMGGCLSPGAMLRYWDRCEELIVEAAQVALRNGLTTVFDTMGPRKPLMAVRDRVDSREIVGSRIFCAGWIVGLDGLCSVDFSPKSVEVIQRTTVERINGLCAENVGPALSWMSADQVAREVRTYIGKGIDFVKYASSEHRWGDPTASLVFSPRVQKAIVEETHDAGLTAQAHANSIESVRVAASSGCDLIQHCNCTGPFPIPPSTLELMAERKTGAAVFPLTRRRLEWVLENCEIDRAYFAASAENCENLMRADATLLLANDGSIWGPEIAADPRRSKFWISPGEDNLSDLDQGHFVWLKAMEEMGMSPMKMLQAATRNIAVAYGKSADLGTLEPGKRADILILDKNPLASAENYRSIRAVVKDGQVVDREALPTKPILTKPLEEPTAETLAYRAHRYIGGSGFPVCPC